VRSGDSVLWRRDRWATS